MVRPVLERKETSAASQAWCHKPPNLRDWGRRIKTDHYVFKKRRNKKPNSVHRIHLTWADPGKMIKMKQKILFMTDKKRKSKRSGVAKWHSACLPYVKPWIQFPARQRAGNIKYPCVNLKNKSAMKVYTYNPSTQFVFLRNSFLPCSPD